MLVGGGRGCSRVVKSAGLQASARVPLRVLPQVPERVLLREQGRRAWAREHRRRPRWSATAARSRPSAGAASGASVRSRPSRTSRAFAVVQSRGVRCVSKRKDSERKRCGKRGATNLTRKKTRSSALGLSAVLADDCLLVSRHGARSLCCFPRDSRERKKVVSRKGRKQSLTQRGVFCECNSKKAKRREKNWGFGLCDFFIVVFCERHTTPE